MQHAKPTKMAIAATFLALSATSSFALLPPSAASAPKAEAPMAVTAAAVKAVAIGKPAAAEQGTLRELESLQRLAALGEYRKKVAESMPANQAQQFVSPQSGVTAPLAAPTAPTSGGARLASKAKAPAMSQLPSLTQAGLAPRPAQEMVAPPTSKVLKVILVAGRARADLISEGKITTVKHGDKLGRWTVAEISPEGVTVERRLTPLQIMQPVTTPQTEAVRPSGAASAASAPQQSPSSIDAIQVANLASSPAQRAVGGSDAAIAAQPSGMMHMQARRDYETYKLPKATDADVQASSTSAPRPPIPSPAIPPLPAGIAKPDSSFVTPVAPPLPANTAP